ncbi:MAG: hypothetical protein Q9207_006767 [Kuettlingeria erythrocarpa]
MKPKIPNWLDQDPQNPLSAIECSPFGKLPIELRLHIYSFLAGPGTIHIWCEQNRLSNSVCLESIDDTKSFGPLGTLRSLVASEEFHQAEVAAEAACRHAFCTNSRRLPYRPHLTFSLFHTCRILHIEANSLIDRIYSSSTFYFIHTHAFEVFVDSLSPYNKALLRKLHLTLDVSRTYRGRHRSLTDTLNRLQPNRYAVHGPLRRPTTILKPCLRLRVRFNQYQTDETFYLNLSSSIRRLITRLPAFLCRTILVIVPSLPNPNFLPFPGAPAGFTVLGARAPKSFTKLVPSQNTACFAAIVTSVMEARHQIREAEEQGVLGLNQWLCDDGHGRGGEAWWEEEDGDVRRDMEVKFSVMFAV